MGESPVKTASIRGRQSDDRIIETVFVVPARTGTGQSNDRTAELGFPGATVADVVIEDRTKSTDGDADKIDERTKSTMTDKIKDLTKSTTNEKDEDRTKSTNAENVEHRTKSSIDNGYESASEGTRAKALCVGKKTTPSVFFIGGEKAGTTSMYHQMVRSVPTLDIGRHLVDKLEVEWNIKEKFFWCDIGSVAGGKYTRGEKGKYVAHYRDCFAIEGGELGGGSWNVRAPPVPADKVPFYIGADMTAALLQDKNVPRRIFEAYGVEASKQLRFVVLMKSRPEQIIKSLLYMNIRDQMMKRHGIKDQDDSFSRKSSEFARMAKTLTDETRKCMRAENSTAGDCIYSHGKSQLRHAAYSVFLWPWLSIFESHQFIFIDSDYFFENAQETVAELARILGLEYNDKAANIVKGKTSKLTNVNHLKPPTHMDAAVMDELRAFFEPLRADLADLLTTHVRDGGAKFIGELRRFTDWRKGEHAPPSTDGGEERGVEAVRMAISAALSSSQ